jgi:hypothetical protein
MTVPARGEGGRSAPRRRSRDADDEVGCISRKLFELPGHLRGAGSISGQERRPTPAGKASAQMLDDGRSARDVPAVIEDRVAKKDDVGHVSGFHLSTVSTCSFLVLPWLIVTADIIHILTPGSQREK